MADSQITIKPNGQHVLTFGARPARRRTFPVQAIRERLHRPKADRPAGDGAGWPASCVRCRGQVLMVDSTRMIGQRFFRGMDRRLALDLENFMPHTCAGIAAKAREVAA